MICSVRSAICQAANATATATVPATAHQGTGRSAPGTGPGHLPDVPPLPRKAGQLAGSWRTAK